MIQQYAFKTSPYPVILSLEVHCGEEQQRVMAKVRDPLPESHLDTDRFVQHLRTILGDLLLTQKVNERETQMPSPEQLKYKILVKGKSRNDDEVYEPNDNDDDDDSGDDQSLSSTSRDLASSSMQTSPSSDIKSSGSTNVAGARKSSVPKQQPKRKSKVAQELSDIVVYFRSAHFRGFQSSTPPQFNQVNSLGEKKSLNLLTRNMADFQEHNNKTMSRVYPAGSRVDSSNYDPIAHWQAGCQVVALNFQTLDMPMLINMARFEENGRSGYLLKPAHIRGGTVGKNAKKTPPMRIDLEIISGQQLPKVKGKGGIIDPFVEVEVIGLEGDSGKKLKTNTIKVRIISGAFSGTVLAFFTDAFLH